MFKAMDGPHFAKTLVSEFLAEDLPGRLTLYRNAWGLDDETLPDPQAYFSYEPEAMDSWPSIITVALSTSGIVRDEWATAMDPIYRVSYSMRTYVWTRSEGESDATLMRDRLTTVVRSALLDHPALMSRSTQAECELRVDETTLREEFSDLTPLKGDRFLAGAYLSYTINLNEIVYRNRLGTFEEFELQTEVYPLSGF